MEARIVAISTVPTSNAPVAEPLNVIKPVTENACRPSAAPANTIGVLSVEPSIVPPVTSSFDGSMAPPNTIGPVANVVGVLPAALPENAIGPLTSLVKYVAAVALPPKTMEPEAVLAATALPPKTMFPLAVPTNRETPVAVPEKTIGPLALNSSSIATIGLPATIMAPVAVEPTPGVEPNADPPNTIPVAMSAGAVTIDAPPKRMMSGAGRNTDRGRNRPSCSTYATVIVTEPVLNWNVLPELIVTSDVSCWYQSTLPAELASITAT